ncbi:hypothetical protein ScPMuIL_002732 [Solemya velum]
MAPNSPTTRFVRSDTNSAIPSDNLINNMSNADNMGLADNKPREKLRTNYGLADSCETLTEMGKSSKTLCTKHWQEMGRAQEHCVRFEHVPPAHLSSRISFASLFALVGDSSV